MRFQKSYEPTALKRILRTGCLRDCGLVVAERYGRYVSYHISDDRVGDILALAESLLADVAQGVHQCTCYKEDTQ